MRCPARRKDQLAYFTGMIERQQLGYSSPHRMAAHNRTFKTQVIHNRSRIISEHVRAVFRRRFTGQAGTAIIKIDHAVISRELGDLVDLPNGAVTGGFAEEKKRRTFTRYLVITIHSIFCLHTGHESPPTTLLSACYELAASLR